MNSIIRLLATTIAGAIFAAPLVVAAHHSMSEFEPRNEMLEIEGVVSKFSWRNPHVMLELTGASADGLEQTWTVETSAVSSLRRRGYTGEEISVGESVRIAGFPSNRRDNFLQMRHLLRLEDNVEYQFSGPPGSRWSTDTRGSETNVFDPERVAAATGNGIFRVWGSSGGANAWYFTGRPLATYQLTDSAAAIASQWDDIADNPIMDCIGPGMPAAMGNPYPMEFSQVGNTIELRLEEFDVLRVIHMGDSAADPETIAPSKFGYSVGRWEGETLVVDTSRISWPYLNRSGEPQTPNVTVSERFTVIDSGNRLQTLMTVDDPATLVEPYELTMEFVWRPGDIVDLYECELEDWQATENTLTN